jgi:hypothetical protein
VPANSFLVGREKAIVLVLAGINSSVGRWQCKGKAALVANAQQPTTIADILLCIRFRWLIREIDFV